MGAKLMAEDFKSAKNWRPATRLVRGGTKRSDYGETSEALYMTSGYVYDSAESAEARFSGDEDGHVYSRYGNPTVDMFEERLALLEGAEACYGTASGMAAVWGALSSILKAGDHIVASKALFGSCYQIVTSILPRFGVDFTLVEGPDLSAWKAAVRDNTKCFFLETPANPVLEVIDIAGVARIARETGAMLVVDNVFATPVLQSPMQLGADIVVYSGTKHIDGQGRVMGGAILSSQQFKDEQLKPMLRHTGPTLAPFNAWVLLKGLETLKLRVEAQTASALKIARALEDNSAIERVLYPWLDTHPQYEICKKQMRGGSTMVAFEVAGGKDQAFDLLSRLQIIDISNNLGDAKSLITHPASTTHRNIGEQARAAMGISDNMLRLSVGLEDCDDLIEDLAAATGG